MKRTKRRLTVFFAFFFAVMSLFDPLTLRGVRAEDNEGAIPSIEFDATAISSKGIQDKDPIADGTMFSDDYFKSIGTMSYRTNGDGWLMCLEIGKNGTGCLQFKTSKETDITLTMASTGVSNTSAVALIEAGSGNALENLQQLEEVRGTSATELTYEKVPAGTYQIVSPFSDYNRGARLIGVLVMGDDGGPKTPRADWSSVGSPKITDVTAHGFEIGLSFDMLIGHDGADKVTVNMYAEDGSLAAVASAAADGEHAAVTFTPIMSGKYTFEALAERTGEAAKTSVYDKEVYFSYPLLAPAVKSAASAGEGKVYIEWEPVNEAELYHVGYRTSDTSDPFVFVGSTTETFYTVEQLSVGQRYEFAVYAVRADESSEYGTAHATATSEAKRGWAFTAYGSSTNLENNFCTGDLNEDGYVRISSLNGKGKIVPASTDGLAFYYTKIDPLKDNFVLSADLHIDSWTFSNGQEGFGIMAADTVGRSGDGSTTWNNSVMAVSTKVEYCWNENLDRVSETGKKFTMKLGLGSLARYGCTAANIRDGSIQTNLAELFTSDMTTLETTTYESSPGTYNIIGNYTNEDAPTGTLAGGLLTDIRLTVGRDNTGYFVKYTDADGEETCVEYYDADRTMLSSIDPDNVYIGFFCARNAVVTFSNVSLEISNAADDAPARARVIAEVEPTVSVVSASETGLDTYNLMFITNADGTADVSNGMGTTYGTGIRVKANEYVILPVDMAGSNKNFYISFQPDLDYMPGEYEKLSSYEPKLKITNVKYKQLPSDICYVSPTGKFNGQGTKDSPIDIYTAVSYAKPGQSIIITEGTYVLDKTIKVERGNNGTADAPIYMIADPEAALRPVFDFRQNCAGMLLGGDYWYFDGFDVTGSKDGTKGIQLSGKHCILQNVNAYGNGNTGIQLSRYSGSDYYEWWPSDNLVLNCTSYNNADAGYEDADGFAVKLTTGDNNVLDGCIAYNNADDGYDLYAKIETGPIGSVTIRNCIAYSNGILPDGTNGGNGNGFKLGGSSITGKHRLINCISYKNKNKGIDSNSCPDVIVENCTSVDNGNSNVALYTNDASVTDFEVNGLISYRTAPGSAENIKLKGSQDKTKVYGTSNFYYSDGTKTSTNNDKQKVEESWFSALHTDMEPGRAADGTIDMHSLYELSDNAPKATGAVLTGNGTPNYDLYSYAVNRTSPVTDTSHNDSEDVSANKASDTASDQQSVAPVAASQAVTSSTSILVPIICVVAGVAVLIGIYFLIRKKKNSKNVR